MSTPAQVTEAHIALSARITRENGYDPESTWNRLHVLRDAQYIADSEAKAMEQANVQVESLLSAAKNAIPASEHPAEPTVENWAWQIRNLGDDRRLVYADRDKLRAEVDRLKNLLLQADELNEGALFKISETMKRAERAEAEVSKLTDALDMMRDEFMRIIACPGCNAEIEDLANRAQLKLIQRVPVITQRDRTEAELATERARLDWLMAGGVVLVPNGSGYYASRLHYPISRAAIDAAMKEETK